MRKSDPEVRATKAPQQRYAHIDAMRAVAVLFVVVAHVGLDHIVPGGAGVTIFFAISGFIITTLLLKEWASTNRFDIGGFYTRRAIKLMPPVAVILVVPTAIFALAGGHINWSAFSGQLLFYYNWIFIHNEGAGVFPGSGVVWSLSIEEQFYIVFALIWIWLARSRSAIPWLTGVAAAAIIASATLRIVLAVPENTAVANRIYFGSDTRAESLAWGILAAIALFKWQQDGTSTDRLKRFYFSDWALLTAALLFLASLVIRDDWFRQTFRFTIQGVASSMVAIYGFSPSSTFIRRSFASLSRLRLIQIIGLSSYSIYLVHNSIAGYALTYTRWLPHPVAMAIAGVLAVASGILLYRVVEVPSRSYYDRVRARRHPANHVGDPATPRS